jgi:hypothetical protein
MTFLGDLRLELLPPIYKYFFSPSPIIFPVNSSLQIETKFHDLDHILVQTESSKLYTKIEHNNAESCDFAMLGPFNLVTNICF